MNLIPFNTKSLRNNNLMRFSVLVGFWCMNAYISCMFYIGNMLVV